MKKLSITEDTNEILDTEVKAEKVEEPTPLKAGTYRYCHGGIGTLSVYMNRRDFA